MHVAGAMWYLPALEAWSLPAVIAGAVWFLGGKAFLRWSLPAIAFLAFMLPLPYRAERSLSLPLQRVAAVTSCWLLECLGEPAVNEGNVIVLHDARLLVAEACSGMRILVSVFALAYAYAVLLDRRWWSKLVTLASALPIAIAVNALRITATGMLNAHLTTESAHRFAHDISGWAMLPVAAGMLAIVPWYLGRLIVEAETASPPELLSKSLAATGAP
jgi:exosortase